MLKIIPVITFAIAGLIHLLMAPEHYGHAPAHGLFFVVVGILEILWAFLYWRRPTPRLYYLGIALAGGLLVLWGITRILPAPFESTSAPVDASGLVCKLCELAGAAALVTLVIQGQVEGFRNTAAARTIGFALLIALMSGLFLYGIGLAAEPLFPTLAGSGHGTEEGEAHSDEELEHGHGTEHRKKSLHRPKQSN